MKRTCSGAALDSTLQPPIALQEHLAHVQEFLNDMYATMIDPVEQPKMNVAEMCELLLKTAREQREHWADRNEAVRIAGIFRNKVAFMTLSDRSYDEFNEACKVLATLTEKDLSRAGHSDQVIVGTGTRK